MGGVVALFARDGSVVDGSEVSRVLKHQAHRGPDGLRAWCDGPVGLGFAALDPTGNGVAIDPLVVDGGRMAMVGDLRIDNRRELVASLDGLRPEASDGEIVLESYRRWGLDAPRHLEGAFAFAIWDAREQRVFCARDHLGIKPLVYYLSRGLLVCASEAEAVASARRVPRRINEGRIADFLVSELEGIDHTSTFFEGVERLAPAHLLVVNRDGHQLRRYWRPDVGTELRLDSDEAYAEAFSETFRQAVGSCLADAAEPGLLLSGGIDSGAIAAFGGLLAEDGETPPLTTYSAIDEENDPSPETGCILDMITHLGVGARTISPAGIAVLTPSVRRSFFDCGEPFDSSMVVAGRLYAMAAEAGSRTVLDGVDGDIVASTSVPSTYLVRRGHLLRAWRESSARQHLYPGASHPLRVLTTSTIRAWMPGGMRRLASQLRNRQGRVKETIQESLIDRDFAHQVDVAGRLEQLWNRSAADHGDDRWSAHVRTVTHPYVAVALERYDRVAARHGIEARHPFFDLRLVKLCLSLPWDLKVRDGWTKFVLRLATKGKVLDAVRWRHDYGDVLWRPTSRVIAKEKSFLRSVLRDREDELGPYLDHTKLERVRQAIGGNLTDEQEVWIWEASTLAMWLARQRL
jgi:asparagine synthase (glutamine-hydrolysing)